eukprot:9987478-Alexandrium_andersonii.AAC.1
MEAIGALLACLLPAHIDMVTDSRAFLLRFTRVAQSVLVGAQSGTSPINLAPPWGDVGIPPNSCDADIW